MKASRCEFSSIRIPNDPKYATAAAIYVSEIAKMLGMGAPDLKSVENGITEAITALIGYSFEPGEKQNLEIRCERTPAGLQVSIRDKGLPFGTAGMDSSTPEISSPDGSDMADPVFRLKAYFDEIQFHNLGPQGKALVLIKQLKNKSITDYYAACDLEPYAPPELPMDASAVQMKCRVRQMVSADAPEVSKTIYKTYGYTYPHDYVYYPEKIVALKDSGQIFAAVALAADDQIAGYGVFQAWEENPQIVEMAQGVVKPEFRSRGCFRQITRYLLDHAKSLGIRGAFGEAVTNHTVTQHTVHGFGFRDCGLRLGLMPPGVVFKGMTGTIPHRLSLLVNFLFLQPPPDFLSIYAPPQHKDIIAALYKELGLTPQIYTTAPAETTKTRSKSVFKIKVVSSMNFARIMVARCGRHIVEELKIKVKELCLKKTEILNLFLNLSDPLTCAYAAQFEKMGFFFGGIFPGGFADGDALILQYLNNVPMDYNAVQVKSAMAGKLLAYIKEQDPNV